MKHTRVLLTLFLVLSITAAAQIIPGTPATYTSLLPTLQPGDTLLLESGIYTDGLNIYNMEGAPGKPIVIMGPQGGGAVFTGRSCCNTVSIKQSAFIIIQDMTIDGQDIPAIDGVKAEGNAGNWAHDISLIGLHIINHGTDQQQVGISTKCPVWNWHIRGCTIDAAGTGMYLGNSNGEAPFVNGLIEYNLVKNTIGYNVQVKHQNEALRTVPGMVKNGKTTIRYNIFSKEENASLGSMARPNLLVGNFPATGDGANDCYEIYGNFFYQNPSEALFQGTGNFALYSNVFLNTVDATVAIAVLKHNGFKPRAVDIFFNTILQNNGPAIRMWGHDTGYTQRVIANAIFATPALDGPFVEQENFKVSYSQAGEYLKNVYDELRWLNFVPLSGKVEGNHISGRMFDMYEEYDKDFDGYPRDWILRGAYGRRDGLSRWQLSTSAPRPDVDSSMIVDAIEPLAPHQTDISVWPNPVAVDAALHISAPGYGPASVVLHDMLGREVRRWEAHVSGSGNPSLTVQLGALPGGMYRIAIRRRDRAASLPVLVR